jgi:hypothetical protein
MTALASDTIDTPLVRQAQIGDQQAVADLLRFSRPIAEHAEKAGLITKTRVLDDHHAWAPMLRNPSGQVDATRDVIRAHRPMGAMTLAVVSG